MDFVNIIKFPNKMLLSDVIFLDSRVFVTESIGCCQGSSFTGTEQQWFNL